VEAAPPRALYVFSQVLSYVWQREFKDRLLLVFSLGALVLSKSLNVFVPFTLKRAIDALEASGTAAAVPALVARLLTVYALTRFGVSCANEARSIAYSRLSQESARRFSQDLFQKFHSLGAGFHLDNPTGALTVAFGRAVRGFQSLQFQLLYSVVPTLLELCLSATVLAKRFGRTGGALGAVALLTFTLYSIWTAWVVEQRIAIRKRLTKLDNAKAAFLTDSLAAQESVKLFNNEATEAARFDALLRAIAKSMIRSQLSGAILNLGQAVIFGGGLLTSMLLAARGFARGQLSLGDVVAVNGLLLQLARPMDFLGYSVSEIRQSLVDMDTSLRTLATPDGEPSHAVDMAHKAAHATPTATTETAIATATGMMNADASAEATELVLPRSAPEVRFENVTFRFPNASEPALREASFVAPAGGMTCLVGASGSGKSTCLRLLARLRDLPPAHGRIVLWGALDLMAVPIKKMRERIGFIAQDVQMFDDTLWWNLRYGNLEAPDVLVEAAASAAELGTRLGDLGGYEMRVGERGARLSGGEKQRVAVARALLRDAPLLLADEAASAVDAPTEAKLVEAMRRGTRGSGAASAASTAPSPRTLITVVHRLAAVTPAADNIVVFSAGRVVEQGTHTQLLANPQGEYSRLWRAQAREPESYA